MTLYVVRHADAGDRAAWTGDDRLRPLSATGRLQAEALAERWAGVALDAIHSGPAKRCVDTVAPLAASHGLPVTDDEALAEGAPADVVDRLLRRLRDRDALLCSHGDVIGAILNTLWHQGSLKERPSSKKAATWVLDDWPDPGRIELVPDPDVG